MAKTRRWHFLPGGIFLLVLLGILTGCTVREGYGLRETRAPSFDEALWRTGEATLFVAAKGPEQGEADFLISDRNAKQVMIRLQAVANDPLPVTLRCDGAAKVRILGETNQSMKPGTPVALTLPQWARGAGMLDWTPESGECQLSWGEGYRITLRPESKAAPRISALSQGVLACGAEPGHQLDPLQKVFLDDGSMLQTCPVVPGPVRVLGDPLDGLNARIAALTGRPVSRAELLKGDADMPLDYSNAPKFDLIQISYLHIRADFSGYLTARMLAYHALRGTQVRILVSGILMLKEDRQFYDSLAARYPNIQIQYYRWPGGGTGGTDDLVNHFHRVQHTRAFLALSPQPGRSRYIFGGRNLHDGFFFSSPFDLTDWPYLHTYDESSFQDLGFYSVYEDVELELRGDAAVRNVAQHHLALWNRDADTQTVGPVTVGRTTRLSGMRHYLSLPWADGRDQVRWFVDAIDAARQEVLIVTPYLNPPDAIQQAMLRAAGRGVVVRLVARIESTDPSGFIITALNRRYVAENAGRFEIEEYSPEPRMMHTKMMVIDRRLAVMTSTNLDHRAFWHDTENGLVFLDTPQVGQLLRLVESYRQTTRRLGPEEPETAFGQALYNWRWLRSIF